MDKGMITGLGLGAVFLGGAALASKGSGSLGAYIHRFREKDRSAYASVLRFGKCRIWVTDVLDEGYSFPLSRVGWKLASQMAANRGDGTFVTMLCGNTGIPMMQNIKGKLVVEGTGGVSQDDLVYGNEPI